MKVVDWWKKFWKFLKKDTWQSWVVSLVLAFLIIKLIFFPGLSFVMGTSLPLVVVESCSMYHEAGFEKWWESNSAWYERKGITKEEFKKFSFKNGLNKGDIILVNGRSEYKTGDIIIFDSSYRYPLIHRVVDEDPLGTKGDHNFNQLPVEQNIDEERIIGKSLIRIPGIGWAKLIFFEGTRTSGKGFCE